MLLLLPTGLILRSGDPTTFPQLTFSYVTLLSILSRSHEAPIHCIGDIHAYTVVIGPSWVYQAVIEKRLFV